MPRKINQIQRPASLNVVWRNPNQLRTYRRRHSFEMSGRCGMYVMQEFVQDGVIGYWTTLSGLEVLAGGRPA